MKDESAAGYLHECEVDSWEEGEDKTKTMCWFYPSAKTKFRNPAIAANTYRDLEKSPPSVRSPFLHGIPGRGKEGELVFEAFNSAIHITSEAVVHRPSDSYLVVYDADKRAGAILVKQTSDGRRLIVDCTDCGKREAAVFGLEIAELFRRNGIQSRDIEFFCDPAGRAYLYGTTKPFFQEVERVCNSELGMDATHLPLKPAFNDPRARHSASNAILNMKGINGKPLLQVHSKAALVVNALASYAFAEGNTSNAYSFDKSDNKISTFGDCVQYLAIVMAQRDGRFAAASREHQAESLAGGFANPRGRDRDPDPLMRRPGAAEADDRSFSVTGLEKPEF